MNSPWLLIDGGWLAHHARFRAGGFLDDADENLLIWLVLDHLCLLCHDPVLLSNRVVICFDSCHQNRRDMLPDYKRSRYRNIDEAMRTQIRRMRRQVTEARTEVLPRIGFRVVIQKGMEADDIIAAAAARLPEGDRAVIVTGDQDMLQCIGPNVSWYSPAQSKMYDRDGMFAAYNVYPEEWAWYKAVVGCPSDGIKGVPGVGVKYATRWLRGALTGLGETRGRRVVAAIRANGDLIEANLKLVRLPLEGFDWGGCMDLPSWSPPSYSSSEFYRVCDEYGFEDLVTPRKRRLWAGLFSGRLAVEQLQMARKRSLPF